MDPSIVFVPDTQAFDTYFLTIPEQVNISIDSLDHFISLYLKDREVLEKYRYQSFPCYEKLKAILHCFESTSLGLPSRRGTLSPAVECHSAIIQVPNQLPRSLSSDSFIYPDFATSSAVTTATSSFPAWSPHRKATGSNQHWAYDNQSASSLSIHPSSASAVQQRSGQHLPAASFDALESQHGAVSVQLPEDGQPQAVSAFPFLSSRASCKRRHVNETAIFSRQSACPAATPIEQSESTTSSRPSAKRLRVDSAAIFGGQSACLEITPMERVENILDSVEHLWKIIRQPPPPPPPTPLRFCMWAVSRATEALSRNRSLSNEQKVRLRQHFCRHPLDAASLPEDNALLDTIFQNMIQQPDML